jgi:hypothetical protein
VGVDDTEQGAGWAQGRLTIDTSRPDEHFRTVRQVRVVEQHAEGFGHEPEFASALWGDRTWDCARKAGRWVLDPCLEIGLLPFSTLENSNVVTEVLADCLWEFIRLGDQPSDMVAAFVTRWGPLGICHHGLPDAHIAGDKCQGGSYFARWNAGGLICEPLGAWYFLARQARAILDAAVDFQEGREPAPSPALLQREIALAARSGIRNSYTVDPDDEPLTKHRIAGLVQSWLASGGAALRVVWEDDGLPMDVGLASNSLFTELGFQLATALKAPMGLWRCDGCGAPYSPEKRRPRWDRRRYCATCSGGASLAAKRGWYHRHRTVPRTRNGTKGHHPDTNADTSLGG